MIDKNNVISKTIYRGNRGRAPNIRYTNSNREYDFTDETPNGDLCILLHLQELQKNLEETTLGETFKELKMRLKTGEDG